MATISRTVVETPLGPFALEATSRGVSRAGWISRPPAGDPADGGASGAPLLRRAARELQEYFLGRRRRFEVPLDLQGTPFQRAVWEALLEIPFGATVHYADIARRLGRPGAARAVGAACGANPVAVLVPCHRILGRDGALTGYGFGIERKRWLLDLETRDRGLAPRLF